MLLRASLLIVTSRGWSLFFSDEIVVEVWEGFYVVMVLS